MEKYIETISILVTLVLCLLLGLISVSFFKEYGWTIFVLIPIIMGFLPPYISSQVKVISRKKSYQLGFMTLGFACFGLLAFAIEGIICIAMASPFLGLLTLLGSYLGYKSQGEKTINPTNTLIVLILTSLGCMGFDYVNEPQGLIPVKTKIIVDADIREVWQNVVSFDQIEEPVDWIFKTGISYPTDATIDGEGVGAIRYCNFTTGSFVEPITHWEAPKLLQFDVKEQPIPMNELNPFWEVHPPHLDGYFQSYKGQFQLIELDHHRTELEGTTWYQVNITPEFYWKAWSNFIIHRIHHRVLQHIKNSAEKNKK